MRATALLTFTTGMVLALAVTVPAPTMAAQEVPEGAGLEREVRQLNTTLGQLVELLRRQLESGNAAVLMQRVQLMTSRMTPLEQELRSARAEQDVRQRELDDLKVSAASFETQIDNDREQGHITEEQARGLVDQQQEVLGLRERQIQDRLWAAQQRVIDLEQSLSTRRTEIETWEGEIDRVLGLRR